MTCRRAFPVLMLALWWGCALRADTVIGIGVLLGEGEGMPVVVQVFPNAPADRAGLPVNGVIQAINGVPTVGRSLAECIAQMRGPEGIPVLLEFIDPATGKSRKMMIVRGRFQTGVEN